MPVSRIAIIGGGLSGLYAAHLLERQGIEDYVLLEARPVFGGRIASVSYDGTRAPDVPTGVQLLDRFDLGPTWFWPAYQAELGGVVAALGLECFAQHEDGDTVIERGDAAPVRMRGYANSPPSMRLIGGMSALIDSLRGSLGPQRLLINQQVQRLRYGEQYIELDVTDAEGQSTTYRAAQVLLALPPRLAASTIEFTPALPQSLARAWQRTDTWMAPHAKYMAIYDAPFWREQGLSGEGRSARGPMVEIHDASMPGGSAALFGFIGVPAHARKGISEATLRQHCRAQLMRMFGPPAAKPRAEIIKDWAADPFTSTAADLQSTGQHNSAPASISASGVWQNRLVGIASEWSPQFPGYVAGAIEAAALGVQGLTTTACPESHCQNQGV